jgi:type VI protein secretion system component VasA
MEKKTITDIIFNDSRLLNSQMPNYNVYAWGEVKELLKNNDIELLDTDILRIDSVNGDWHDGQRYEPYAYIEVTRDRLETDEELAVRVERHERSEAERKERRRQSYEKLKKEFDPEVSIVDKLTADLKKRFDKALDNQEYVKAAEIREKLRDI